MSSGAQTEVDPVKEEVVAPKPKQYLIMTDEIHRAILGKIMPGILFVQVEGMAMKDNSDHMLLVNPIVKPATVAMPDEVVQADV